MLTFYAGSGSQYAWKVWLALEHKAIPYELRMLSFQAGDPRKPEYLAINPRGKVPAIVDDGFALYESSAIVEYLEDRYPDKPLWPGDVRTRAIARRIAAESVYLMEAVEQIYDQTFFLEKDTAPDLDKIADAKAGVAIELARLPFGKEWLAGALSAADYTIFPSLAQLRRLQVKFPQHETGALLTEPVRAYMARLEALPYYDKTIPPHWRG